MSFTNPSAFLLLLLLPLLVFVGWPRLAYRRRRDATSLLIRLVLVLLVIVALAGVQVRRAADKLAVVFLIDVSDSVSPAQQSAALDYVRIASDTMREGDQAAVVVFGSDALVEVPITERLELVQIGSDPVRLHTDLAEAMRLGMALFPADTAKRMVILSDGQQTVGEAEEVARLAAATDVQIDTVFVGSAAPEGQIAGPEVLVKDVSVPAIVNEGESFDLSVTLATNRRDSRAEVQVMSGGSIIHREEVALQPGDNTLIFPDIVVPAAGFVDFRVAVEPRGADGFYQNNQLSAFTQVTGPPRVLLVTSDEREIETLRGVLEVSGLRVNVQGPREVPLGLAPLSQYDSIVLANVSAADLSEERMAYLQAYVRDLGGGLIVIGGPNSYGVGGYFETALEDTLPVEMRIRDQERIPQLTMLFVIDRSGSMEMTGLSGVSNLELAKEAVARSFDLLNDTDRTGVLSFDISAYFVLELQEVGDAAHRAQMRDQVGALRPGGGTNIRQGVLSADRVLRDDPSQLKHIILLTDGGSDPSGIIPAVDRMFQNYDITTSVVAVGQDYARWLQDIAAAGRGQFHLAYDVSTIPAIFTAETILATRSYIFEQDFVPTLGARHPIMDGVDRMPALKGYIATTEKDTASVILRGPEDDPLLAAWQYGLGRAVAFTSDASPRWAANWIGWDGYASFWNQAVRWTIIEDSASNIEARVTQRGDQTVVTVDARDTIGDYLNGLRLDASVINAQLQAAPLQLQQVAPGRYEAVFLPQDEGAYFITVAGRTPETAVELASQPVVQTAGWVLSYSSEYAVDVTGAGRESGESLLSRISSTTGGSSLRDKPETVFLHNLNQQQAAQPVWPRLLLVAVLLLVVDVAIRRLVITRTDVENARQSIAGWLGLGSRGAPEVVASSARMDRLLGAKDRARGAAGSPDAPRREETSQLPADRVPEQAPQPPKMTPPSPTPSRDQATPSAPPDGSSLASRLLERRKTSRRDPDEES